MEPAEEIVTSWLKQKGYLTMNEIKVGLKEIDILAVDPITNTKLHIEVKIAIKPVGGIRLWGAAKYAKEPLPDRIRDFCRGKFIGSVDKETRELKNRSVEEEAISVFGDKDYDKILVCGTLHLTDLPKEKLENELAKYEVKLIPITEILADLQQSLKVTFMDDPRRYLQIFSTFIGTFREESCPYCGEEKLQQRFLYCPICGASLEATSED